MSLGLALILAGFLGAPLPAQAGPGTTTTTLAQPDPTGTCGDANGDGAIRATDAFIVLRLAIAFPVPATCTPLVCNCTGSGNLIEADDALAVLRVAVGLDGPDDLTCPTAAHFWNEVLLDAIRRDLPRPTVHARNLFYLSIAFWDIWAIYDQETGALPYLTTEPDHIVAEPDVARSIAISYAAYRLLTHRFANSPNATTTLRDLRFAMDDLALDRNFTSTEGDSPAAVGNRVAAEIIAYGATDGANEAGDYADPTYQAVNMPLIVAIPGTTMAFPNRWQPLSLEFFFTQNGIPLPITVQKFVGSHWDDVTPFALVREVEGLPYDDPGPPPLLGGEGDEEFKAAAVQVIEFSSWMDPDDGVMIDISPGARGNSPLGTNDGTGHALNPATGEPYTPNIVLRGDYGRILAEFWADGPDSETPPGHWNTIANYVSNHPSVAKRFQGEGEILGDLEWDVKLYFAINGALHDAAVAAWGAKAVYDYARPISMIRHMAGLGQSSLPEGASYHPDGLPLVDGLVELITDESSAPGQRHEHLKLFEGQIAIYAWAGNPTRPKFEYSGAAWQLGVEWVPYQRETFVSPPFAGYVSGHSTFSRAAAEVLTRLTGSSFFPGGMGTFRAPAGEFLEFELGPTEDIELEWATYQDAADEAGLSRLYGGIHVRADDFGGRIMGERIGNDAFDLAVAYFDGTALP